MLIPNWVHNKAVHISGPKAGSFTEQWEVFINQLITQLQINNSNEGTVIPSETTANIDIIAASENSAYGLRLLFNKENNTPYAIINGVVTPIATGSFVGVFGTPGQIVVVDGTTTATVSIDPTYIGQPSITTLGTIDTGTWEGGLIETQFGGTGQNGYSNGQLLIGNSSGELSKNTLIQGSGITITNGDGTITISATGSGGTVTSITAGTGLTGGVITNSGTIALDVPVSIAHGGTALTATPTNGQLLIGNGANYSLATLTQGTGVTITNGSGTITISATGTGGTVTSISAGNSITCTPNPIVSTGSIDTIQDIRTSASPTFTGLTLSGLTINRIVATTTGSVLTTLTYSTANVANAMVQRDGSGNCAIGQVTGNLAGNATTATTATNATNSGITNDSSTNATMYPVWVTANTGNLPLKVSSTGLSYNPSTRQLTTVGGFVGPLLFGSSNALSVRAGGSSGGTLTIQGGTSGTIGSNSVVFHSSGVPGTMTSWGPFSSSSSVLGNTLLSTTSIKSNETAASEIVIDKTASSAPSIVASFSGAPSALIARTSGWSSQYDLVSNADSSTGAATTSSISLSVSGGDPRFLFGTSANYIEYDGNFIFTTNLLPDSNAGANLGTSSTRWNQFYVQNIRWGGQSTLDTNMVVQGPNSVTQQAKCFGWNTYSTEKIKENIVDSDNEEDLRITLAMRTIYFNFIKGQGDNIKGCLPCTRIGYSAEDIAQIFPQAATFDENGEPSGAEYSKISVLHAGAIKAHNNRILAIYDRLDKIEKFLAI